MVRPHAEMSTSALIDKMFEDVLQAADGEKEDVKEQEEERQNDSHVSESRGEADVETAETEPKLTPPDQSLGGNEACDEEQRECENQNEEEAVAGEREENTACNEDFLSLPPSCVLSPLSKSVEAAITLMVRKFMALLNALSYLHSDYYKDSVFLTFLYFVSHLHFVFFLKCV